MKLNELKNLVACLDLDAPNINCVCDNLSMDEYELFTGAYCPNNDYYGLVLPIINGLDYNAPDLIRRGSNWFVVARDMGELIGDDIEANRLRPYNLYIKMVEAIIGKEFFIDDDIEVSIFKL